VAQLIAYMKVDLLYHVCDPGVKKYGMSITKTRPKEEMLKMEARGKYVRRKKGQVYLSEKLQKVSENQHYILQQQDGSNDDNITAEEYENKESPAAPTFVPNNENNVREKKNEASLEVAPTVTDMQPVPGNQDIVTSTTIKGEKNQLTGTKKKNT
jgi:hypothetical protein